MLYVCEELYGILPACKCCRHVLKVFNCGLSGAKALSVPDVGSADLHTIRKRRQHDQISKRCMLSDQEGSESSPSCGTSSVIILLTSSLSGMN